jgi:hypothetical protein
MLQREIASLNLALEFLAVARVERSESVEQFKKDNSDAPDVSLIRIAALLNYLRCHVQRCSTNGLVDLGLVLELLREPKVSNFYGKFLPS